MRIIAIFEQDRAAQGLRVLLCCGEQFGPQTYHPSIHPPTMAAIQGNKTKLALQLLCDSVEQILGKYEVV